MVEVSTVHALEMPLVCILGIGISSADYSGECECLKCVTVRFIRIMDYITSRCITLFWVLVRNNKANQIGSDLWLGWPIYNVNMC